MRKEKDLVSLLSELVRAIADEYGRNPLFARRLDALLDEIPEVRREKGIRSGPRSTAPQVPTPDIYREFNARTETEFRLWIQRLPVSVLREVIRAQDFDATRRTTKWNDSEKLGNFITDQLTARVARGSAFLRGDIPSKDRPPFATSAPARSAVVEEDIDVGSVVVLASGSPRMTVVSLNGEKAVCTWIDGDGRAQHAAYPVSALRVDPRGLTLA